ncbi:MAG: 2'-5' RNA ligase family protein [Flavobacteriales bacterium]|nr:2'-5' RNA ligase family protein [Flavobacteriales bacterium]MEB2341697.1 2'-5' RNA ligase family protein [Flavobacteriia bacterium]
MRTGPTLTRFLLTILPTATLAAVVVDMRERLHARIGSFSGRNLQPHITLCFLDLPETHEADIIRAIESGVAGQRPFTLHYRGITHFPDRRTIYIDPVEKEAIATVRTPIVAALRQQQALSPALRETGHPHLTIAAGLMPAQFEKAWGMLGLCGVETAGQVGEVVLLKRLLRQGERYALVQAFPLHGTEAAH